MRLVLDADDYLDARLRYGCPAWEREGRVRYRPEMRVVEVVTPTAPERGLSAPRPNEWDAVVGLGASR